MTTPSDSFHIGTFGAFAGAFRSDLDGQVHLSPKAVAGGRWPHDGASDPDWCADTARHNREALESAECSIEEWRAH